MLSSIRTCDQFSDSGFGGYERSGRAAAAERLAAWRYAFLTTNPPERGVVDGVTRWLVVTRAGVLPLTLFSGLLALLLAADTDAHKDWWDWSSPSSASWWRTSPTT